MNNKTRRKILGYKQSQSKPSIHSCINYKQYVKRAVFSENGDVYRLAKLRLKNSKKYNYTHIQRLVFALQILKNQNAKSYVYIRTIK